MLHQFEADALFAPEGGLQTSQPAWGLVNAEAPLHQSREDGLFLTPTLSEGPNTGDLGTGLTY